jgi:glycosyltransferase involved in cell wall biosynthesis
MQVQQSRARAEAYSARLTIGSRACRMGHEAMKKTLLYISVHDPHVPMTGSGTRVGAFVNQLAQRFDLDLVYLDGSGQPPNAELSKRFASHVRGVGSKYCVPFSQARYFLFSIKLYREAARLLKIHRYDYLICDYGLAAAYGLLLSRRFGVPFIYCSHNIEYRQYLGKVGRDFRRLPLALYMYWVERLGVAKADLVVAISAEDAQFYTRWRAAPRTIAIPQGFDDQIFNPFYQMAPHAPKTVLFCGNFKISTNRDVVNTVMKHILGPVLARCPGTLFRFVGGSPPRDIKHPNIEFTGFLDDYANALKAADVVISPMLQGWGFPTKIVEALACGKITITTPVGARALESDYETLRVAEIKDFAAEICRALITGPAVSTADYGKVKARYSWETNVARLANFIDEAPAHAGRPT